MLELLKSVLAARKKGLSENLFEVIIFIVIAAVYAIGGIMKMRSSSSEKDKGRRQGVGPAVQKPRYKSLDDLAGNTTGTRRDSHRQTLPYMKQPGRKAPPSISGRRRERVSDQMVSRKRQTAPTTRPEQISRTDEPASRSRTVQKKPVIKSPAPQRRYKMDTKRAPRRTVSRQPAVTKQVVVKTKQQAQPQQTRVEAEPQEAVQKSKEPLALLKSLSKPDDLKMAIIYSEVLGSPLALRDRQGGCIGW